MEQERVLLPLINACEVGVIVLDPDKKVEVWNDWIAGVSGVPAAVAYGAAFDKVFDEELPPRLLWAIDDCLTQGASSLLSHSIHRAPLPLYEDGQGHNDGRRLDQSITVKPVVVNGGRRFCLLQISDVSVSSAREHELRRQSSELAELARHNEHAERRIRAITDTLIDALICFTEHGEITSYNLAAERMFGIAQRQQPVDNVRKLLVREDLQARVDATLSEDDDWDVHSESIGFRADGTCFPIDVSVTRLEHNEQTLYIAVVRDLTHQRAIEDMAHRGHQLAQVALESIRDGVITTDEKGAITYLNTVAIDLTGMGLDACEGKPLLDVFRFEAREVAAEAWQFLDACLSDRYSGPLAEDALVRRPDRSHMVLENRVDPLRDKDGGVMGSVLVFRDNTLQHTMVERLSYHATHDELTGLLNRREFDRRLDEAIEASRDHGQTHALCYMDLDQFKVVNDTSGHTAGDELLRRIGDLLRKNVRSDDVLARLGGDEFGLLLLSCDLPAARRVVQKLREAVEEFRFLWEGKTFSVGVSVGLVELRGNDQTKGSVMSAADTACYAAKEHGRNRVWEYTSDDNEVVHRQGEMQWVSRIHEALEEDRLQLYCQAIAPVGGSSGDYTHYEVLLRMVDRQGELIPPMAFIPAAERYDLMTSLDRWVVSACLKNLAAEDGLLRVLDMISINISGQSLGDERFLAFVEEQLSSYEIAPDLICFEITETAAIANLSAANEFIDRLKARGCKFALDDFGSGLSSFAYLKSLPVDFLKIDGVFVKDMENDLIDAAMVESINRIGQVVGIRTIAEFVENEAIMRMLGDIGVDFAQGWGIAKPEPMDRLVERFTFRRKTA